jgi:thioredoxin reductase (NADPH)
LAKLIDSHTIELTDKKGNVEKVTSKYILICTGGRPSYPNIPGAKEFCITSDDLFSLKKPPGKTLIIGASYIAVECSGILASLGYDTTIMVRSMLLRGFDRDMAKRVEDILIHDGIKFFNKCTPEKFSKNPNGTIRVEYQNENGEKLSDEFDTVLLAVGRKANTQNLNLEKIGIKLSKNGKIIVDEYEQTSINNIYSIGDCAEGRPELAPPVIMAGKLLSRRLFNGDREIVDYNNIATTIYSSIEYGSCGMSEEKAKEYYGKDNIKVYHSEFTPVEWTIDPENEMTCYIKVIVNTYEYDKVVGFHIFSPNAGEITQGVSVAMKCGLTKDLLDCTIGIHPTIAEEMTTLDVTKDMGSGKKTSC